MLGHDWGGGAMQEFPMPSHDESGPTEFAGRDPEFKRRTIVTTDEGNEVVIVNYLKDKGLYVVSRKDGRGPLFRISPAHLRPKPAEPEPA